MNDSVDGAARHMDRRSFLALTGALAGVGAVGASGEARAQKRGGTLRLSAQSNPSSLNPQTGNSGSDHVILYPLFDTLVEWDYTTLQSKPGLAEKWAYPNPTTLVLTIRDGVTFHDGAKLDGEAVRYNLLRAKNDERSNVKSDLATVEDVTASGQTVTLKLKSPDSALPLILSDRAGMISSPKAMEEHGRDYDRRPVGTGAMKFVSWADNERVVMTKNDNYWKKDRPLQDGMVFQIIPELPTGLRSVTAGQNDLVYYLVPQQKQLVDRARNVNAAVGPSLLCVHAYFHYGRAPLDNVKVRQALNYAVDREEFNKATHGGIAETTSTILPRSHWACATEFSDTFTYDPDRARKLLAEGGHPDGIDILGIGYAEQLQVQQQEVLIEQMRRAGIRLRWERYTGPPTPSAFFAEKKGDLLLAPWTGRPDPSLTYQLVFGAGSYFNAGRGEGAPGLTEALLATRASDDLAVRKEAFRKLQKIVTENALHLPLLFRPELTAYSQKVKGYKPNLLGKPKLEDVWVEG